MTHFRACNICEAMCGLAVEVERGRVTSIRGDRDDPFSRGYSCGKAAALARVHADPARLREPMMRSGDRWEPLPWSRAIDTVGTELTRIRRTHGADAVAIYLGNPVVHDYGAALFST